MSYQVGVDLGTTYSAVAVCRPGRPVEAVPLGQRARSVPSTVYAGPDGAFLIGEAAERRALSEPGRVVREFKRRIGDPTPVLVGRDPMPAEQLATRFISRLLQDVAGREGAVASRVAITHPAGWGPHKLESMRGALAEHGLGSAVLLSEPQAAAVGYANAERVEPGATVAVYDLGGGTFDAAVVRKTTSGGFTLLGTPQGLEQLGGVDFDEVVFAHVRDALGAAWENLDPTDPEVLAAVAGLRRECTAAKEALSHDTEVLISVLLPGVCTQVRLGRTEFEEMIRPAVAETVQALRRALDSAGVAAADLSALLLVGGSSRIPLITQAVSAEFGRSAAVDVDPKGVIAAGAAVVARAAEGGGAGADAGARSGGVPVRVDEAARGSGRQAPAAHGHPGVRAERAGSAPLGRADGGSVGRAGSAPAGRAGAGSGGPAATPPVGWAGSERERGVLAPAEGRGAASVGRVGSASTDRVGGAPAGRTDPAPVGRAGADSERGWAPSAERSGTAATGFAGSDPERGRVGPSERGAAPVGHESLAPLPAESAAPLRTESAAPLPAENAAPLPAENAASLRTENAASLRPAPRPPKQARPFAAVVEASPGRSRVGIGVAAGALVLVLLGGAVAFGAARVGANREAGATTPTTVTTVSPVATAGAPAESPPPGSTIRPPEPVAPPARSRNRAPARTQPPAPGPATTTPPVATTEQPTNGAAAGDGQPPENVADQPGSNANGAASADAPDAGGTGEGDGQEKGGKGNGDAKNDGGDAAADSAGAAGAAPSSGAAAAEAVPVGGPESGGVVPAGARRSDDSAPVT